MTPPNVTRAVLLDLLRRASAYPPEVRERLEWFLYYLDANSVSATCQRFGISRSTFYRWHRRFDPARPESLIDKPSYAFTLRDIRNAWRMQLAPSGLAIPSMPAPQPVPLPSASGTVRSSYPLGGAGRQPDPAAAMSRRRACAGILWRTFVMASLLCNLALLATVLTSAWWAWQVGGPFHGAAKHPEQAAEDSPSEAP